MENSIKIFEHKDFGKLTAIMEENGKPWFIGNEVAKMLGYASPKNAIYIHCKYSKILKGNDTVPLSIPSRGISIIPESDLYRLIMKSEMPIAESFQDWVVEKVLPSIRKTGSYSVKDSVPDFTDPVKAARAWADQYEQRLLAEKEQKEVTIKLDAVEKVITEQKPKVRFAEAVESSSTTILVGEMAKLLSQNGIDIGQNRFFEFLRDEGYLIKRNGTDRNMPTQRSMEQGLFEIKERTIVLPNGAVRVTKTPKITGKGQQYFITKMLY